MHIKWNYPQRHKMLFFIKYAEIEDARDCPIIYA